MPKFILLLSAGRLQEMGDTGPLLFVLMMVIASDLTGLLCMEFKIEPGQGPFVKHVDSILVIAFCRKTRIYLEIAQKVA